MLEDGADDARLAPLVLSRDAARLRKLTSFDLTALMGTDEAYRHVWYTEQLFCGNEAELVARARTDEAAGHLDALAFVGALELTRGHVDESIALFEKACGLSKKKLPPFQRRWVGSLRILALLARPSHARLEAVETLLRQVIGKHSRAGEVEDPMAIMRLADYWATLWSGRVPELRSPARFEDTPISALIWMLVTIWTADSSPSRVTLRKSAETLQGEARTLGYRWLEHEYGAAILGLAAEAGSLRSEEPGQGPKALVDLVGHRSAWMITLEKLQRVAESAAPRAEATEAPTAGASRIAWFVHVSANTLFAEPRLQTEKRGSYTKGRPIALERFQEPTDPTLPVTSADRAVAAHLRATTYGYGKPFLFFASDVALGLVGHPHVFDTDDPSIHFEVKRGRIELRCERGDDGSYTLRLDPNVTANTHGHDDDTAFVRQRGSELCVYEVTDEVRKVAALVGQETKLPAEAEASLQGLLPKLSVVIPTSANLMVAERSATVEADATPVLRIRPKPEAMRVELLVTPFGPGSPASPPGEGNEALSDFRDGQARHVLRSFVSELDRAQDVLSQLPSLGGDASGFVWSVRGLEACLSLIAEVSALDPTQVRVEWPDGQPLKLRRAEALQVTISGGDATRWFEAEGSLRFSDGVELRLAEILERLRRREGRFIALSADEYAELGESTLAQLQLLESFRAPAESAERVLVAPWMALAMPERVDGIGDASNGEAWRAWRKRVRAINKRRPRKAAAFLGTLRDYQEAGFAWLCRMAALGTGVCLADDMGLGKTIQALALLEHRATRKAESGDVTGPMLIVAPASVCPGWIAEAARFTPDLELRWHNGAERSLDGLTRKSVVVATYDILHRDRDVLTGVTWDTVVLDEAHNIKNAHTRRSKAAYALQAGFRLATTGTPIENHLGELWSLFHFLMPGLLGDQHAFVERFRSPIEIQHDTAARSQLQNLVRPFLLRRTKQQVLSELPPRTEIVRRIELSPDELELYEAIRLRGLDALSQPSKDKNQQRVRVLAELMRLRRACCHPRLVLEDSEVPSSKLAALLELIDEMRDAGHRALVFSQFVDHLTLVREALDDRGLSYQYLDGATPVTERAKLVEAFQSGKDELFLISLRAGGTGLNLTAADYVIHLDPWWNPAVEDQASDRAHRIGQERPVTVYRLVAQGTIEERLVAMHTEKRSLAADILDGTANARRLEPDELIALLREASAGAR